MREGVNCSSRKKRKHGKDEVSGIAVYSLSRNAGVSATWINVVIEVLPLVQPDLCESRIVVVHYLAGTTRECIWC